MRTPRLLPTLIHLLGICFLLVATAVRADHDLILSITEGVEQCDDINNTTYAVGTQGGGCEVFGPYSITSVISGSYMWVDLDGDSAIDLNEQRGLAAGPDGGIWVEHYQPASGWHIGLPNGSESPSIDQPWAMFGNTGLYFTDSTYGAPIRFLTNPSSGSGTLNFTAWRAGYSDSSHDLSGDLTQGDTGIAIITCTPAPCAPGSNYVLDYTAHPPLGDPFYGLSWAIHLEGTISGTTGSPPNITLNALSSYLTHPVNTPFTDPGATADDFEDGDLGNLTGTGSVDIRTPGEYTLQYQVTDSDFNTTTASLTVYVAPLLAFDMGAVSCVNGIGTPPDACVQGTEILAGSWFGVDYDFSGIVDTWERTSLSIGPDGGLQPGIPQPASGSHLGLPDGSEQPGIDMPWDIFSNTGMHYSTAAINFMLVNTLDFSSWAITWGDSPLVDMGGDPTQGDSGIASIICDSTPCLAGDNYTLDYTAHVPAGDPSGFGGYYYELHLEGAATAPFTEDFESGLPTDWQIENGVWEVGTPTTNPAGCFSGTQCAGTILDGDYSPNTDSRLISPTVTLPTVNPGEELLLRFQNWFAYSTSDYGKVQISVWDGATSTWGAWIDEGRSVSQSSGWSLKAIDLTTYAGETVRIAFNHVAVDEAGVAGTDVSSGWFIDDLQLVVFTPTFTGDFEAGWGDWSADRGIWQVGTPTAGPAGCYSGTQCAGTLLDENYKPNTDSRLISPTVTLPMVNPAEELQLRFQNWFAYSTSDSGQVQISVWDGATSSWGAWIDEGRSVSQSSGWSLKAIDLTTYAGETVRIAFNHTAVDDAGVAGDDVSSGWFIDDLQLVVFTPTFTGDFEAGWGDWLADRGIWQVGTPTTGPAGCYSGTQCAGTLLDVEYKPNTDSRLISPTLILPILDPGDEYHLSFWHWLSYSVSDFGQVQVSVWDGVTSTWGTWINVGTSFHNNSGWTPISVDLTAYAGEQVRIAFNHEAVDEAGVAGTDVSSGWYIDDITMSIIGPPPPVLDLDGLGNSTFTTTFTEDVGAVPIVAPGFSVSDANSTSYASATITITNSTPDDVLAYSGGIGGITVDPASTATNLILNGPDTDANFAAAILAVTYNNTSDTPDTTDRIITIAVQDDTGEIGTGTTTMHIAAANDMPVIDLDGSAAGTGYQTTFTEGAPDPVRVVDPGDVLISDPDGTTLNGATITLNNQQTGDTLSIDTLPPGNIEVVTQTDNLIILDSPTPAAHAEYATFLEQIRFSSDSEDPLVTPRSIRFTVTDEADLTSLVSTTTLDVIAVNDLPELTLDADGSSGTSIPGDYQATFAAGSENAAVRIADTDIAISDLDDTHLTGANITLTNPQAGDTLNPGTTLPTAITVSGAGTDTLTLSGYASIADYTSAIRATTFDNPNSSPAAIARTITVQVTDYRGGTSDPATTSLSVTFAPVVDLDTDNSSGAQGDDYQTVFLTGTGNGVTISDSGDVTVADGDSSTLSQVVVELSSPAEGDVLSINGTLPSTVAVAPTSTPSRLILLPAAPTPEPTLADYAASIGLIEFNNPFPVPDPLARTATVTATDETGSTGRPAITTIAMNSNFAVSFAPISRIVLADSSLTYTLTITNVGNQDASDVVLTSLFPEDAFITANDGTSWDCNDFQAGQNPTTICSRQVLPTGVATTVTIEIQTPSTTGVLKHSAVVSNGDPAFGTGGGVQETTVVDFMADGFHGEEKITDQDPLTGPLAGAGFGASVALHNDLLVIGTPDDAGGAGSVSLYRHETGLGTGLGWTFITKLAKPGTPAANGSFGAVVAYDGSWLLAGAPNVSGGGEVWAFDTTAGYASQQLVNPDTLGGDEYAFSVALDGGNAVIGARSAPETLVDGGGPFTAPVGRVYLFQLAGPTWTHAHTLRGVDVLSPDPQSPFQSDARFGSAVDIQGDRLVVGVADRFDAGRAFVYRRGLNNWALEQELLNHTAIPQDEYGRAVVIDGGTIAVGTRYHSGGAPDSGAAHVFVLDEDAWLHQQQVTANDAIGFEEFGASLDLQGDTLLVGAPYGLMPDVFGEPTDDSGAIYIMQRTGAVWNQQQKILAGDSADADEFGRAVAIFGEMIVAGAPAEGDALDPVPVDAGAVYSYQVMPTNVQKLMASVQHDSADFGAAVAVDGDWVVIGAPYDDVGALNNIGSAYVYLRVNAQWTEFAQLIADPASNPEPGDWFGGAVAIDGDWLVVGAENKNVAGGPNGDGAIYIFHFDGSQWVPHSTFLQDAFTVGASQDHFGTSVAIANDTILVGAPDGGSSDKGTAWVLRWNDPAWVLEDQLQPDYATLPTGANFGYSVDLDADTAVIAARYADATYVFTRDGAGDWSNEDTITVASNVESVAVSGDSLLIGELTTASVYTRDGTVWSVEDSLAPTDPFNFITSVALLGNTALVGDTGDDASGTPMGAAHLFVRSDGIWTEDAKLTAPDAQANDQFGKAVAIGADARVVGAWFEDGDRVDDSRYGAAYLYPTLTQASLLGGSYNGTQLVTLDCGTCSGILYSLTPADSTPAAPSVEYTVPIEISASSILQFVAVDAQNDPDAIRTETYLIDQTAPTLTVETPVLSTDPLVATELNISPLLQVPITGTAQDDVAGSGLQLVQVEIQDAATLEYVHSTNGSSPIRAPAQKWLSATGTSSWSLPFTGQVHPFEEGHTYNVRVRAFDQVGNVSQIVAFSFGFYTGDKAFTTLGLTLNTSSILSNGEVDVTITLDDPGNEAADFTDSTVYLDVSAPCPADNLECTPVVTTLTHTTNSLGVVTLNPDPSTPPPLGAAGSGITFDAEGTWTIQARYVGSLTRQGQTSPARILLVGESAGYAMIIQGRLKSGGVNEGLAAHNKTANRIYDTLKARGFQDTHIWYFNPDTNQDDMLDGQDGNAECEAIHTGDGCNNHPLHEFPGIPNGIDGLPTQANIAAVFNEPASTTGSLANLMATNPAPFYLVEVDHGGQNPTYFYNNTDTDDGSVTDEEVITPTELAGWFNALETEVASANLAALNKPRVAILGMCYSGGFIDALSAPGRYIITSAAANEESYKGAREADGIRVGEYFLEEFFLKAGRGVDLYDSLRHATRVTETFTRFDDSNSPQGSYYDLAVQHPLVDTNGDHVGSNDLLDPTGSTPDPDGLALKSRFLGVGPTILTNSPQSPADMVAITPTAFVSADAGDTTELLRLTANDDTEVFAAWVEIREPQTTLQPPLSEESLQIDPNLIPQLLAAPVPPVINDWFITYNDFTVPGKYEVFHFVQDKVPGQSEGGAVSPAQRSVVYKNRPNNDFVTTQQPTGFQLLSPTEGESTPTALAFDWSPSSDDDGLTYTFEIATDSSFATLAHVQEELGVSHTVVDTAAGLEDGTTYFWRVIAIDSFGTTNIATHVGTGNPYGSFNTNNDTNAQRGFIYTTVQDALSFVALSGATVSVSPEPPATCGTTGTDPCIEVYEEAGQYTVVVEPAGVYTVSADATGYLPADVDGVDASAGQDPDIRILLSQPSTDTDGDGLTDAFEAQIGTDLGEPDSDFDGVSDYDEVGFDGNFAAYNPYDPVTQTGTDMNATPIGVDGIDGFDTDGDGIDDATEFNNTTGSEPIDPAGYPRLADGHLAPLGNPDTVLNGADYLVAMRIALGLETAGVLELAHGDMNDDGVINVADLVLIMQLIQAAP